MDTKYAACVLLRSSDGLFLSVSRKGDPSQLGFPGGACEEGENLVSTAIRELYEETGLTLFNITRLYTGPCLSQKGRYEVTTYYGEWEGEITSSETGVISWVTREALCDPRGPFWEYNVKVFEAYDKMMS